ncbi:hypothetical protein KA005_25400 [bacterium]|nr:hypothetical protein [bacterium]
MNMRNRIEQLEQRQGMQCDIAQQGILYFHENLIIVDGQTFTHIEDIPENLRKKHEGRLIVGQVEAPDGRTADVTA